MKSLFMRTFIIAAKLNWVSFDHLLKEGILSQGVNDNRLFLIKAPIELLSCNLGEPKHLGEILELLVCKLRNVTTFDLIQSFFSVLSLKLVLLHFLSEGLSVVFFVIGVLL